MTSSANIVTLTLSSILILSISVNGQIPDIARLPTCCDFNTLGFGQRVCPNLTNLEPSGNRISYWDAPASFMTNNKTTQFS